MTSLAEGAELDPVRHTVTPEVVQAYGEVARDFNPIHFDDEAARALGLPGRIAHGMISGAVLSHLLTRHLGEAWLRQGRLRIKFVAPVPVGDSVVARATVRRASPPLLDVRVEREDGLAVIVGQAELQPS